MRKKVIVTALYAIFVIAVSYGMYYSSQKKVSSNLELANVEALASCEIEGWVGSQMYHITFTSLCSWICTPGGYFQCPR